MKILVTGGAGFIGSNFVHFILNNYDDEIVVLDALTYAGNLDNLKDIENSSRFSFVHGDIRDKDVVRNILKNDIDIIVNFAAETHVDRSIYYASDFLTTDIYGTFVLLESAREFGIKRFVQISTDEVYGSISEGYAIEDFPLNPSSPYSASKSGGDLLCLSFVKTYNMDIVITRSSNNFGKYQYPEKLIPFFIIRALNDEYLPLYGDGRNVRDWLPVEENCRAIDMVMRNGKKGNVYNIGSGWEKTNIEITELILKYLGKDRSLIKFVKDRPGHDRRYAIDTSKIRNELGWNINGSFEEFMGKTVKWYVDNKWWWQKIINRDDYQSFIKTHYRSRV